VTSTPVRTRFAPSPTGWLHLGSARTALFAWLLARHTGGEMVLRIEDTDAARSTPEFTQVIFDTLAWLGLDYDGEPVYQSQRADLYAEAAAKLLADGKAYYCDCTRDQIDARAKERGGKPGYDGVCRDRDVAPGEGVSVRFRTPDDGATSFTDLIRGDVSFPNADLEDFVIVRASGQAMFLLANAVDDVEQGVNHVLRGEDLLNVTPKVLLLRRALGHTDDPVFAHLPLLVGADRKKLSKRKDSVAIADYQNEGFLPEALVNYIATLGWGAPDGIEIRPIGEIVELFDIATVSQAPAFFDRKKLEHFNGEYIRALTLDDFIARAEPFVTGSWALWPPDSFDPIVFRSMAPLVQERVKVLSEIANYVDFLFVADDDLVFDAPSWEKVMVKGRDKAEVMLDGMIEAFETCDWDVATLDTTLFGFGEAHEIKKGQAQAPIRVAVTGRSVGPPLLESLVELGRARTLARLRTARAAL
jgi:glutamyl-tRNA synthetase